MFAASCRELQAASLRSPEIASLVLSFHSAWSATMGSTALARRVGNQQAMNATNTSAVERSRKVRILHQHPEAVAKIVQKRAHD
jgi:hypothetical protein